MPELTIEPNEKYWRVVDPVQHEENPAVDHESWPDEHKEAASAYIETVDNTPEPEDYGIEPDGLEPLTWGDFSVSSDPDLVAKMATYFDGMAPDEPTDALRAKLRLLDPEVYANAQIAATGELRL